MIDPRNIQEGSKAVIKEGGSTASIDMAQSKIVGAAKEEEVIYEDWMLVTRKKRNARDKGKAKV